jgi:hypothetical protein
MEADFLAHSRRQTSEEHKVDLRVTYVRVEKKRQSRAQDKDYTYCGQSEEVES